MRNNNFLRSRVDQHNQPFDALRERLGANETVHGQPWRLWGFVQGFGGATHQQQSQAAKRFEGLLLGDHVNRRLSVNDAERIMRRMVRHFTEEARNIAVYRNIRWRRVLFQEQ